MNNSVNLEVPDCEEENSFAKFMDEMISKYRIKRIDISRITGISQDYLYKLLNGTRHTNQRDYILAICCAVGMKAEEAQQALILNQMEVLDETKPREKLILDSFRENVSLYRLNDRLEKAGYPWLRFARDMETYVSDLPEE